MMTGDRIDLHVHSSASDGTFAPAALPGLARSAGLVAIALTDHDTVSGLADFLAAAPVAGIEAVPGVEISTLFLGREVHIVGLFVDSNDAGLQEFLAGLREQRNRRNEELVRRLQHLGYEITLE